jgi:succinoglycan biosynthesis protein ExoA
VLVVIAPIVCLAALAPIWPILIAPALAWASVCIAYGLVLGVRLRDRCAAAAGVAAIAMQAGWSFGFFAGLAAAAWRRSKRDSWRARLAAPAHGPDGIA